jgi:hypothetical protein
MLTFLYARVRGRDATSVLGVGTQRHLAQTKRVEINLVIRHVGKVLRRTNTSKAIEAPV